ncbi:MAG: DinB family protein [Candidatus Acidiferrales bacterium]
MAARGKSAKRSAKRVALPATSDVAAVLVETFAANGAMNDLLLANLDAKAWRVSHPLHKRGEGRTIAAIFVHMHNNRLSWIRRSAPHLKCPAMLDPDRATIAQARAAHRRSNAVLVAMLKDVLLTPDPTRRRIKKYSRGSWSQDWPAGATMFGYMFAHDAHHRGQIILLVREMGFRLPVHAAYGIWHWEKLWKACGFTTRPR